MATNNFSKEERVMFEDALMGFDDALTISKNVATYNTSGEMMERAGDTFSRPVPYILNSQDRVIGSAVTAQGNTQLKVPASLTEQKTAPFTLNAKELRDLHQEGQLGKAAYQRLASDLDQKVKTVASMEGSLVVAVSGAAGTYDNVALAESLILEQGMQGYERCLGLTARDYNGLAGNLSTASRSFGNEKSDSAYERSYVGMIAGFDTLKLDAGKQIGAAGGGGSITVATNGSQVQYAPTSTADNRYQSVTFSSTTGMAAGDCFTIAGVEAAHHITKETTNQPKTFRVISVTNGTTAVISPPMIGANQGSPTDAEKQYKNINVASTSATAAVSFLNANAAGANPFWLKQSIEILPGSYSLPEGQGVDILRETTENGIEVVMGKSFDNSTFETLYTFDVLYGVTNLNPEQNGIILFNQ
jgi:hypothetical protein